MQQLTQGTDAAISLLPLLVNFVVGVVLALLLSWHFRRFASTLSNREGFAQIFPFILLTTMLIITIVKSSLALSLGLVGALSIVRFRTPIKEPEELAYLFVAIAIGVGLGANQTIPTVAVSILILAVVALIKRRRADHHGRSLYLSIDWAEGTDDSGKRLERLNSVIADHAVRNDLRRFDAGDDGIQATYLVDLKDPHQLPELVSRLRQEAPDQIDVTFIDQQQLPGV